MASRPVIAFLIDNNVPDSIVYFLQSRGHDVARRQDLRDVRPLAGEDDPVGEGERGRFRLELPPKAPVAQAFPKETTWSMSTSEPWPCQ